MTFEITRSLEPTPRFPMVRKSSAQAPRIAWQLQIEPTPWLNIMIAVAEVACIMERNKSLSEKCDTETFIPARATRTAGYVRFSERGKRKIKISHAKNTTCSRSMWHWLEVKRDKGESTIDKKSPIAISELGSPPTSASELFGFWYKKKKVSSKYIRHNELFQLLQNA